MPLSRIIITSPLTYMYIFACLPEMNQELSPEDLAKLQIGDDKQQGKEQPQQPGREKTRLTKGTGQSIKEGSGKIGGPFTIKENPEFLAERLKTFEALAAKRKADLEGALCLWVDGWIPGVWGPGLGRSSTARPVRPRSALPCSKWHNSQTNTQPSPRSPSRSRCPTAR